MANFIDDIADYLQAQGIGTVGTDIFVGKYVNAPDNQIAVLSSSESMAESGAYIPQMQFPGFQIMVRNLNYAAAAAKVAAIRSALHVKIGLQLSSFYVLRMHVTSSGYISEDSNGRPEYSINVSAEVR